MKKSVKTTLLVLGFVVLLAVAACAGYYFATDGDLPFLPEKTTQASDPDANRPEETKKPKNQKYPLMEEPPYNEYALVYLKIGNLLGNLQNGGRVAPTLSTIYQAIPQTGIFKFSQETEGVSFLSIPSEAGAAQDYVSLNRIDGKLIYIDSANHALYATGDGATPLKLADEVEMCYVYDQTAYFTTEKGVYSVGVSGGEITTLFQKEGWQYSLVGLSNSRIYFLAQEDSACHWLTVGLKKPKTDILRFMGDSQGKDITGAQYSDGWLYYLKGKTGGGSDLYRKHIGLEDEARIAENVTQYVVDKNCVYFGRTEESTYHVWELNTASGATKVVLSVPVASVSNDMTCYIAGEYVYAIGTDGAGTTVNCRTCLWTAANDLMYYNDGARDWKPSNG